MWSSFAFFLSKHKAATHQLCEQSCKWTENQTSTEDEGWHENIDPIVYKMWVRDLRNATEQLCGDASRIVLSTQQALTLKESKSSADQKNLLMSIAKNEILNFAFGLIVLVRA